MNADLHPPDAPQTPALRILVVDDEYGPRESLKLILTPTYDVLVAKNGQEALERFAECTPDMVISDMRMPIMTGLDLMKAVKSRSPDTPFVLLTGYGTLESAQEALRAGAFDYINKPYHVEEIRRVVTHALEDAAKKKRMLNSVDRLQALNSQLEHQVRNLDQKASIGDLSAEMIHDLNNPITVLRGYIALLEDSLARESHFAGSEEKEFLDVIKVQTERCIDLMQKFLDYARNFRKPWDKVDVNSMVQNTLAVLRVRMRRLKVHPVTDLQPDLPEIWAQPTALQQVFYNLIANAIDALEETTRGGKLTVTTRLLPDTAGEGAHLEICISDTGPGIPEEIRDRIFMPFFSTKPKGKGTGLGLAICQRGVDEHGGTIQVESEFGKGTCFRVLLPALTEKPASATAVG